jgi:membrane-bound serine protease (ClpP class)
MSAKWLLVDAVVGGILKQVALFAAAIWGLPALGYTIPLWAAAIISLALAAQSVFSYVMARRTQKRKAVTGSQTMVGRKCVAATRLNPSGYVKIDGELWQAVSESGDVIDGLEMTVIAVNGIELKVRANSVR